MNLALFDFDGTICRKDSMIEFMKFCSSRNKVYYSLVLLSPFLLLMKLGLYKKARVKEMLWTRIIGGTKSSDLIGKGKLFALNVLPKILYQDAIQEIKRHLQENNRVIIVTASGKEWIEAWTKEINVELLATELEIEEDHFTGKIKGNNCNGIEKVKRISSLLNLSDYNSVYVYGDSSGDREMLSLATHPYYKYFKH